jgi:hypothetical protein
MRGVIPCTVPVRNLGQQHVRIVDLLRVDEDEIFGSERSLACRFGYCYVILEILLTPSFIGWYAGSVLTVFLDLFVSGIRGSGTSRKKLKLMRDAIPLPPPTPGPWAIRVLSFR